MGNKGCCLCFKTSNCNESNPKKNREGEFGNKDGPEKNNGRASTSWSSEEKVEKIVDRISDLPDAVSHHVLSFLPIKTVAQTSVLSRRWSSLWASYPFLDFSIDTGGSGYYCDEEGIKYITRVLSRRQASSSIEVFRVMGLDLRCSLLHGLIRGVLKHHVVEIALEVGLLSDDFYLPQFVLECDSLRSLRLKSRDMAISSAKQLFYFKLIINSKGSTGIRSRIRTLSLSHVEYFSDSCLDVVDLFSASSFPCLEDLTLTKFKINKTGRGHRHLKLSCPKMKHVKLCKTELNSLDISGPKLESLTVAECDIDNNNNNSTSGGSCRIKVFAPNLHTLVWRSSNNGVFTDQDSWTDSFPILRQSRIAAWYNDISMQHICAKNTTRTSAVNLLSASCQVEKLEIFGLFKILSNIYFGGGLPFSFTKMETLVICTGLKKCDIPGVACLLKSSPVVHRLQINIYDDSTTGNHHDNNKWNNTLLDYSDCTEDQYWESQAQNLRHFLCNLKEVEIGVYGDCGVGDNAMSLASFLLQHGRGLQEVFLSGRPLPRDSNQPHWRDKLASLEGFHRASTHVKISVDDVFLDEYYGYYF